MHPKATIIKRLNRHLTAY